MIPNYDLLFLEKVKNIIYLLNHDSKKLRCFVLISLLEFFLNVFKIYIFHILKYTKISSKITVLNIILFQVLKIIQCRHYLQEIAPSV